MRIKPLNLLLITIVFSYTAFAQTTFFIKYKDDVEKSKIQNKVINNLVLPSTNIPIENNNYKIKEFAKGIASDIEIFSRIIKVEHSAKLNDSYFETLKNLDPDIEYIQPSVTYKIHDMPNDSLVAEQWALAKIKAFDAWRITKGQDSVIIGIIDTGIDYNHPDLKNKIYYNPGEMGLDEFGNDKRFNGRDDDGNGFIDDYMGWDFTDRVGFPFDTTGGDYLGWDNDPMDENSFSHGTAVAGIIGAETNNLFGIAGVGPNLRLLNLRAFDPSGYGEEDDVAAAILYAVKMNAKVINMSFGDYSFSYILRDVIRYAYSQGVVLVGSSGNNGRAVNHYPSGYSEVISVGNSTENDFVSASSTYGSTLDLVAPGTRITTTVRNGGYTTNFNGTSAAAPHVSAAAGLILSLQNFTNEEVKQILKSTTDDIGEPGWDLRSGSGRLNLYRALSVLAPATVKFNYPRQDFATFGDTININITAVSPYFEKINLFVGKGLNPTEWSSILLNINYQFFNNEIATLNVSNYEDGDYTLRMVLLQNNGITLEERVNFIIDRTAPTIELVSIEPALYGNESTVLAEIYTSKRALTKMYFRKQGTTNFNFVTLDGFATNNQFVKQLHYGFIPKQIVEPNTTYEIYFEASGLSGLREELLNNGNYFIIKTNPYFNSVAVNEMPYKLPLGVLYKDIVNFTGDSTEILLNQFYPSQNLYYSLHKFDGTNFIKNETDSLFNKIPRAVGDYNNNGKTDLISTIQRFGYIDEQQITGSFTFNRIKADSSGSFFPIMTSDINKNGKEELISILNDTTFQIFSFNNDLSLNLIQTLRNFSGFEQNVPFRNVLNRNFEVADLNGNGLNEIWFLDRDGDLVSYNYNTNGSFTQGFVIETDFTSRYNNTIAKGDFDGDGIEDLAVIFQGRSIAPYQHLLIFNMKNNEFNPLFTKTFLDQSAEFNNLTFLEIYNSIRFVDIDNDGKSELIVNLFPYLYVFKHNGTEGEIIFYEEGVNTNQIFAGDLNKNGVVEVGIQTGNGIKFYEFGNSNTTATPNFVQGYSIDSNQVFLSWNGEGELFYIYKGTDRNSLLLYDSTFNKNYTDINVLNRTNYFYGIRGFSVSRENKLSAMSSIVQVYVHPVALVTSIENNSSSTLIVTFSERINNTIENLEAFSVTNFGIPNSISAASQNSYLLTFNTNLPVGTQNLKIKNLKDYYGSPIPEYNILFTVVPIVNEDVFFVESFSLLNNNNIKITFNLPYEQNSVQNKNNYEFSPENSVISVQLISDDNRSIIITTKNVIGSIGKEYKLILKNILSSSSTGNIKINENSGSVLVLRTFAKDLSDVYTYPNPVKVSVNKQVTFANLPQRAEIIIFSINGERITTLKETNGDGGVTWNLIDDFGREVNSGVYIYRVVMLDNTNNELEEKLGKFAIVK